MIDFNPSELAVIGAVVHGGRDSLDRIGGSLSPSDFHSPILASVFRVALDLYRDGKPVDATLLRARLDSAVAPVLLHAYDSVRGWTNTLEYAREVRSASLARQAKALCEDAAIAVSEAKNPAEAIEDTLLRLRALLTGSDPSAPVHVSEASKALLAHIDAAAGGQTDRRFVPTGIDALDGIITGFRAGQLSILAARTSIGKSVAALQVAEHAAVACAVPTLVVSLEMPSSPDLASRFLAPAAKVAAWKMLQRPQHVSPLERAQIARAVLDSSDAPVWFWDTPRLTVSRLAARARRMAQSDRGLGLVVLDYLGLLDPADVRSKSGTREREVAEQSRELKALAMELQIPVVVVVQLNRQAEGRDGQSPRLHDLRESGSLEMDAYLVVLLSRLGHRDEKRVLMDVAKHRNGPTGRVEARLDTDSMRLVEARVA